MEKEQISIGQEKKVEELHWDIQQWKSHFQFMENELTFIARLLASYAFQPNTPKLFERLQDYKSRIKKIKTTKKEVRNHISKHENTLGGILECTDSACDLNYYRKHKTLKAKVIACFEDFQNLKSEILNYAGGILKKRKP